MNIIFDNIIFSLQPAGGISVVWQQLLQRAVTDKDINAHILEYQSDNTQRKQLQIPQNLVTQLPLRFMERYRQPVLDIKDKTVFHSSYFRIANSPNVSNITTVHDLTYHFYRHGPAKAVHLAQEEFALRHSKSVICVSETTKKDLLRLYPFVKENDVRVIYNGVSDMFKPVEADPVTRYDKGSYLLYVGNRDARYKKFPTAVYAAGLTNLPLVIAGSNLNRKEEALLNRELGNTHYQLICHPDIEMLNLLYNQALCLLYPSCYEGFGLPVTEAQKAGCIPIVQDCSCLPETAGDGAVIVQYCNNSRQLAASVADAVRMIKNGGLNTEDIRGKGKTNSQRFSWDKTYNLTRGLYRDLYCNL